MSLVHPKDLSPVKKPKKPKKRKGGAHHVPPSAQVIMRREMEESKKLRTRGEVERDMQTDPTSFYSQDHSPMKLGAVLDEVIGQPDEPASTISRYGQQQRRAKDLALDIIDQYELQLSLKQWAVVQSMVEQGIMTGVQLEIDCGPS